MVACVQEQALPPRMAHRDILATELQCCCTEPTGAAHLSSPPIPSASSETQAEVEVPHSACAAQGHLPAEMLPFPALKRAARKETPTTPLASHLVNTEGMDRQMDRRGRWTLNFC